MLQAGDPLPGGAPDGAGSNDARLIAFDQAVAELTARTQSTYEDADSWLEQTRAVLIELLRFCDDCPETARELVVESIAWGTEVLRRRAQLLDTLAVALDRGRAQSDPLDVDAPNLAAPASAAAVNGTALHTAAPSGTAENLLGACISLVHTRLLEATAGSFLELAPLLMCMIAHPYLGPEAAKRELERPLVCAGARAAGREPEGHVAGVLGRSY